MKPLDRYKIIAKHYEDCLEEHGDTHQGVDWPKPEDLNVRYQVMLDIIREDRSANLELLDFGCGTSHLYTYLIAQGYENLSYSGLDISEKFIEVSRKKFPKNRYFCLDILTSIEKLPRFDYIVLNGVFTQKRELSDDEMFEFLKKVILALMPHARKGIAFNVMTDPVDWKRDAAFHLPFSVLAEFLVKEFGRYFSFRQDYGLYEYTTYLYKEPFQPVYPGESK